ncbi:MAG: hypothetical protein JW839_20145, partial [Candidatus Lokiarchaeota archaeon]|nr:hypothetical protein [Candidatus Lokiarchaeota archaeon]
GRKRVIKRGSKRGAFLAKRAIELKLRNIWYLVASFWVFVAAALVGAVDSQYQIFLQPFAPLLVIAFTRNSFYDRVKSGHVLVGSVALAFTMATLAIKTCRLVACDTPTMYLANHVALFGVFFVAYAWLAKACFNARVRLAKEVGVDPWVGKRYLLLGTSAAFISLLITPAIFMHSIASYLTAAGFLCVLLIVIQLLAFSVLNYLCWVMPPWFKRRLGSPRAAAVEGLPGMGEQREAEPPGDKLLTTRETIAITDYLGNMLAARVDKSPAALKGLLLVVFQSEQDEAGFKPLSFSDLMHAIDHKLKLRLQQLGVKDAEAITRAFGEDVARNQSILLMLSV